VIFGNGRMTINAKSSPSPPILGYQGEELSRRAAALRFLGIAGNIFIEEYVKNLCADQDADVPCQNNSRMKANTCSAPDCPPFDRKTSD